MPDVISRIVLKRCSLSIVVALKRKKILWRPGYQGGSSTINYNFLIFERSIKKTGVSLFKGQELSTFRVRRYKQNFNDY